MEINKFNEFVDNDDVYIENIINNIEVNFGNCSDLDVISNSEMYKKLIEKGNISIPFLLEKLDDQTCMFWINALRIISGDNPDKNYIKTSDIRESWKKWAKENGYK